MASVWIWNIKGRIFIFEDLLMDKDQVLAAISKATFGSVGTYAFLSYADQGASEAMQLAAGSNLKFSGVKADGTGVVLNGKLKPSGAWMCCGRTTAAKDATLWLRIS